METTSTIAHYLHQVQYKSLDPKPYDRLMIYYRLQKKPKMELKLIEKAIALFTKKQTAIGRHSAAVERLSKLFGRSTGLVGKNGKQLYLPVPVQKWMRRKEALQKKMK